MGLIETADKMVYGEEAPMEEAKRKMMQKDNDEKIIEKIKEQSSLPELEYPTEEEIEKGETEAEKKQKELKRMYDDLKNIIKKFIDTKEENYEVLALWIIGTWLHENFPAYPYLFINAMKGSGKTRLLKLIKELSKDGDMLASLSEAVMFRTTGTLCIDEFESIQSKDKNALRELLNTAYKKGGKVKRMKRARQKTAEGIFDNQVVEEFDTFRPIVMANISGMEEVLADRCITIILEKSSNNKITRKVEDFSDNQEIQEIKKKFAQSVKTWFSVGSVCMYMHRNIYTEWNKFIDTLPTSITPYTHTTLHTPLTLLTQTTYTYTNYTSLFEKIFETGIDGRNLELMFPLMLIAAEISILDGAIKIIQDIVKSKKEENISEGKDIMLFDFISRQEEKRFYKVNELTTLFKQFIDYEADEEARDWLKSLWMGKALKRLNLLEERRRIGAGVEVTLNIQKANEKMKIFRT